MKKEQNKYYDGTKLLSLKDINGNKPELYIVTTNRTGGKTTYFSRLFVKRFLENGEKFMLLYRFNYELDDCANNFFKDIKGLFFPEHEMTDKKLSKGIYADLYLDEKHCGYAVSLNNADQIKKRSHLFSDTKRILFDEFQSDTCRYCDNEVSKFLSIHTSVARGEHEQRRYLPVYMLGNPSSIINPYYVELGISDRLSTDTKFLRGDGFVMEQGFNESASKAQKESGMAKAFKRSSYVQFSAEAVYLNDSTAFVEKPKGNSSYVCTLKYEGREYAIREYPEQGIVYCDDRVDATHPRKITVTTADHGVNYVMVQRNNALIYILRNYFEHGCFRFKNQLCKSAVLHALAYH